MPDSSDAMYRALRTEPRREICRTLVEGEGTGSTTLTALSEEVQNTAVSGSEPFHGDGGASNPTAVELHHVHLQLLDDAAILEYDPADREVRPGPELHTAIDAIRTIESDDGT